MSIRKKMEKSKPVENGMGEGNVSISSAILSSGSAPAKALRVFDLMGLGSITYPTYMSHHSSYVLPSVNAIYYQQQSKAMEMVAGKTLAL